MRGDDPTQGVRPIGAISRRGFHIWDENEIAKFEVKHPIGSKARLALALGLFTGQARQDVIGLGPQHIRDEILTGARKKTAHSTAIELFIPVVQELRMILEATPADTSLFLLRRSGSHSRRQDFGNGFREQCDAAGLPHCTFHGLRKAAARRLAEHGCTPHEIAAITGHATLKENRSAMDKIKMRTGSD